MKLTYFGHSCFQVKLDGATPLFDPFISPNPAASAINVDVLRPDYVLLTHGHSDHVADAERILKNSGATLVSNYEIVTWFAAKGIENAHPLNHGGGHDFPFGRVSYVNAIHSSMLPDGSYGGNPGGFVIKTPGGTFYVSGDTALTMDMKIIGDRHRPDFAVLCIGDNFTMGPDDAALAAEWAGVRHVVGVHYDTFPPIAIDHGKAREAFAKRGIELHLLPIGASIEFPI